MITPWNFPLNLASRKIGPALAAGNTVVFKPSPMTPLMGERLAAAFIDAGLPAGVLNVVHGFAAGAHLVDDARVDAVTFTGSNATGLKIHAAIGLGRRVQLELGGKNPIVVLADADLDAAAADRRPVELLAQRPGVHRCRPDPRRPAGPRRAARARWSRSRAPTCSVAATGAGITMGPLIDDGAVSAMQSRVAAAVDRGGDRRVRR